MQLPEVFTHPAQITYLVLIAYIPCMVIEYIHYSLLQKNTVKVRKNAQYNFREISCNFALYTWRYFINVYFAFFTGKIFADTMNFQLFHINMNWLSLTLLIVLQDFLYYCYHYTSHKLRFIWIAHSVHHSSEYFNYTTALRLSPLRVFSFTTFFWLPLIIIGYSPEWITVAVITNLVYQFFIHTQAIKSLGFLELLLNTPAHHRVHHGKNKQYLDKNFGGILIIWDRIFGTFEQEVQPVEFGITKSVNSANPIKVALFEFMNIFNDFFFNKKKVKQKIKSLYSMKP